MKIIAVYTQLKQLRNKAWTGIIPRQINSNPIINYCRITPRSDKAIFRSNLTLQENSKIKGVNKLIFLPAHCTTPVERPIWVLLTLFSLKKKLLSNLTNHHFGLFFNKPMRKKKIWFMPVSSLLLGLIIDTFMIFLVI